MNPQHKRVRTKRKSVIYNLGRTRVSPTRLPAGSPAVRNVHPHCGTRSCKQISRAKANRLSAAAATSETRRRTSVIQNQLAEITGLCLFRVARRKEDLQSNQRARKNEPSRLWNKLRQDRNKQARADWRLLSSPSKSPKQLSHFGKVPHLS